MTFWIISSAMSLVVATTLAFVLLRSRQSADPAAAYDLQVYRDQLKDVDRDLERGVISDADASRIRTEVSRRILAADTEMQTTANRNGQSQRVSVVSAAVLGLALISGSLMMYQTLGVPGYPDLGLASRIEQADALRQSRPPQAEAEAEISGGQGDQRNPSNPEYATLVEKLRIAVADRPDDLEGLALLARSEATLGNYTAARKAQARLLEQKGDKATIGDFVQYADMMVLAAGGYVSPEAEAVLNTVLHSDPQNGPARYYSGVLMAQTGRPDLAFRIWDQLLQDSGSNDPWVVPIRAQIGDIAQLAGVDYALPSVEAPAPGPSADDIEAASDMSPEDRQEMIRGMVQGLSDRLATQGGTPVEWGRLIGALGVLGETERAKAIYDNAQQVFAGNADALEIVTDAAKQAGIAQ